MQRTVMAGAGVAWLVGAALHPTAAHAEEEAKRALQALNEFIGTWQGNGGPPLGRPSKPSELWREGLRWEWQFTAQEPHLSCTITKGKYFRSGTLRYDKASKQYQFFLKDINGQERRFQGPWRRERLELYSDNPKTRDRQRLIISANNRGARLVYEFAVQRGGRGLFRRLFQVQHTREGVRLGSAKKTECIVTGGLGTMPVRFQGKTYYVCCSGCAEAFRENPAKIIAEYQARKEKK